MVRWSILPALLEYNDDEMMAEATGSGGQFSFVRSKVPVFQYAGNNTWKVLDPEFDTFKELAPQRLSTVLDITVGQAANAYIHFDGSNDYVEFTGTAAGLLIGMLIDGYINLVEFEVRSDAKFITLFKSGSNAIMLRRGGSNHGLYVTGNNGGTKIGANTWYAPNAGGKMLLLMTGRPTSA